MKVFIEEIPYDYQVPASSNSIKLEENVSKSQTIYSDCSESVSDPSEEDNNSSDSDYNLISKNNSKKLKKSLNEIKKTPEKRKRRNKRNISKDHDDEDVKQSKKKYNVDRGGRQEEEDQICSIVTMKCELCDTGNFRNYNDCKLHYRKNHDLDGYLMCCDIKYTKRSELVLHVQKHLYPDGFL